MRRRAFIAALGSATALAVRAQQPALQSVLELMHRVVTALGLLPETPRAR